MCRALKIVCAAPTAERLAALKRASVSAQWEVVGGATSTAELIRQVEEWRPDVVVIERGLDPDVAERVRGARPQALLIGFDSVPGVDREVERDDEIRAAILGGPAPAGPVIR